MGALNPGIRVIARTEYLQECGTLCDAGADRVISDEVEVALAVTEYILQQFGATPDQIDASTSACGTPSPAGPCRRTTTPGEPGGHCTGAVSANSGCSAR